MLAGIPLDLAPIVEGVLPGVSLGSLEPLSVFVISFPSFEESFTTDRALLSCTILTRVDFTGRSYPAVRGFRFQPG